MSAALVWRLVQSLAFGSLLTRTDRSTTSVDTGGHRRGDDVGAGGPLVPNAADD